MIARLTIHEEEGGVQTLTIPPELALPASEVFVTKEGGKLTVEPVMIRDRSSFFAWLKTVEPWDGPGPDLADPPPGDVDH
jgi:virulence-associated protein VagC